ncbi:glycosyltransferase family 2 protein [Pseudoalteromonas atlantica]|uniref:glycosyltransferase family 2 protein n=1 Tax=Pseudoalteromonas atlantica TaxID=288 RepID=UPI003A97B85F
MIEPKLMPNTFLDVSVIIPAYNCSQSILRALESIFMQSTLPKEVIIVDDGSQDETQAVVEGSEFASRVTYVKQSNGGPSKARNYAISLASCEWLAFLDADDLWVHKDKLRLQMELIDKHPDAVLIDTYASLDWHGQREETESRQKDGDVLKQFLYSNIINATSSVLAKREHVVEMGGFVDDLRFGEDRLLWAQLANRGGVYTLPVVTVKKYNAIGNLTSKGDKNYHYRVDLVNRLLGFIDAPKSELADIWLTNVIDFFRLSFKANDPATYLLIFNDTLKHKGAKLWLTKYGFLAFHAKVFNSFTALLFLKSHLKK